MIAKSERWPLALIILILLVAFAKIIYMYMTGDTPEYNLVTQLQQYTSHSYGSADSPLFRTRPKGELTDIVFVDPSFSSTYTALKVLTYVDNTWHLVTTIPTKAMNLGPYDRHTDASSKNAYIWFRVFNLNSDTPGVGLYDNGNSGWDGLVVARLKGRWQIIPFINSGGKKMQYLIGDPMFRSPTDVVTTSDNCHPFCYDGKITNTVYKYDKYKDSFIVIKFIPNGTTPDYPYK